MKKELNIIELMTQLACNVPNEDLITGMLKLQPDIIRLAIEADDIKMFKSSITNKYFFANSVQVTKY